jgi:glycosyltransferase involved in cell wall biosynthesis
LERPGEDPFVSIVVPTYNSQKTIAKCLQSIKDQTYKKVEAIVVDRYSTDNTMKIAKQFGVRLLFVTQERSTAKNYAARQAFGDFLLFVDSDMLLAPETVEECVDKCTKTGADAIAIPLKSISQGRLSECRKIERESLSDLTEFMEAPRFIRKSAFLRVEGFDEKLVCGEDFDLTQRLRKAGHKIGNVYSEILHFEGAASFYEIFRKAYYYGRTIPALMKKEPKETARRYANIRFESVRTAGVMFRRVSFLLNFVTMKILELMAYATGILAQLFSQPVRSDRMKTLKTKLVANRSAILGFGVLGLVSIVIFRNFLFSPEWPGGGDVSGFVSRAYLYGKDFRWLYMWRGYSFGFVEGLSSMDFFLMVLYWIFKSPSWTVKVFMFLSYLAAAFSMYVFSYRYTHRHIAALSASLVYVLNQWFFSQLTEAHADIIFSYALAPLLFVLLDKTLESSKLRNIIFLSLGLSIFVTGFHPECTVIYSVFLAIFALFFLFFPSRNGKTKARLFQLLRVSVLSALFVSALSAFFLFPFVTNVRAPYFHSSYTYPLEDALGPSYANVAEAFTLRAVERWGYVNVVDVYSGLGVPDFPVDIFLLLVFILAYCTLFFHRDRYTFFFAFSAVVSVFLAKGPYPPFGQFFVWAWANIPHFAIFRAANRWIMMAVFSDAFFVSLLVCHLASYVEGKSSSQVFERYFRVKVKNNKSLGTKKLVISVDFLNAFLKRFRGFIHALSILLLICIFLSGFLSCFFFFSRGLQVFTPSEQYLAPYEWLASQEDDDKVVSVCRGPSEWADPTSGESDFASGGMLTTLGWTHDLGFDSSFIHDKPVLQNGGLDFKSRQFVDYLRFRLARGHLTDRLLKMLGPFAYNYLVIPFYTTNQTRTFFLNQEGGRLTYNQSGMILQNDYAASRVFGTNQSMFVVGGFESIDALCKIGSFNPSKVALYYAPESVESGASVYEMVNRSQVFCFANSNIMDLAMMSLGNAATVVLAGDYGFSSLNLTRYWVKWPSWRITGALVLGGEILTTVGKNKIDIPFQLTSDGLYNIYLRVGFAPTRGKLRLSLDGEFVREISPYFPLMSKLDWVNMTSLNLAKGKHCITLENDGSGYNDVDAVAIVKPHDLESRIDEIVSTLQGFQGRLLYLLEAENTFLNSSINDWYWTVSPYTGYVIRSESLGLNVAPLASVNATSESEFMEARRAIDGSLKTRWTSEKNVLPQMLELTWNSTQKLRGLRVTFENAYATDYTIQTWNGTWINQTAVVGNNQLERMHSFTEPVETTKLRICVTGFSDFYRVSIWELDAYSVETISASSKLFIPRKGNYMVAARVATGPNYGTICFRISDKTYAISCNDTTNRFGWREIGPFNLTCGETTIGIGGVGPVELDELLLYSLKDGENYLPLSGLFNSSLPKVSVSYEKVNPCTFRVHVNASEPFILVFSEAYNPLWKASTTEQAFISIPAYSLINSFYINKTGQFTLTIYFTGQTYADIGLITSLVSFTSSVLALPIVHLKTLRKPRFIKQEQSM